MRRGERGSREGSKTVNGLDFDTIIGCQQALQEKYRDKWGGLTEKSGRNQLLWMMVEVGEVADIMKKKGDERILHDEEVRRHFVEEMSDVLMYFGDIMLCYGITPKELGTAFAQKYETNMKRW